MVERTTFVIDKSGVGRRVFPRRQGPGTLRKEVIAEFNEIE